MKNKQREKSAEGSAKTSRARMQRGGAPPLNELQQSGGNKALVGLLSGGVVQRKAKDSEPMEAAAAPMTAPAVTPANGDATPAAANVGPALIVEDDAKDVKAGQMRKSDFLSQLRTAATSAAETALAGTMWSAMGCPYIDRWLDHYSKQPSAYLERALQKYVPEATSVRSASEYLPLVQQRLRRGIEEWRTTGEVKDLPPEFAAGGETPGMTAGALMGGLVGGLVGGALSAVGGAISSAVSGIGSALSSVGHMLFKRHEGAEGEMTTEDPAEIRAQLGGGHSLDGATQRRMQSAFGVDFAGVRVHTDTRARELTEGMQARAFTIGSDIAFGGDEYKPGTPVGDALIAHELAHVVQQGSSTASGAQHKGGDYGSLEEDADRSAVGAVMKLWSGASGELSQLGRQAMPRMRSGLRLQGCDIAKPKQADQGMGLTRLWTVQSLMEVFYSKGDEDIVKTIIDQGYTIISFEQAFDTWQMPDGSTKDEEVWTLQGSQDPDAKKIWLPEGLTTEQAATALYHEVAHAQRPKTQPKLEQEIEVRIATEEFNIKHGFPPFEKEYRNADGTVNKEAIRKDVMGSNHYNPGKTRKWLKRRYVGEKAVAGWKLP